MQNQDFAGNNSKSNTQTTKKSASIYMLLVVLLVAIGSLTILTLSFSKKSSPPINTQNVASPQSQQPVKPIQTRQAEVPSPSEVPLQVLSASTSAGMTFYVPPAEK